MGLMTVAPLVFGFVASPSRALILDEEDEDLVEKAKANRKNKIALEKATTREFLKVEGLKNAQLEKDLIPVQKAVLKLAKAGQQIEGGDIRGASSTMNDSWVKEFQVVSPNLGSGSESVATKITDLKNATDKGDAMASKKAYVAVVADLEAWVGASGLSSKIKGIN